MARGDAGGRVRRSAVPQLRIVGAEAEVIADPANTSATARLAPKAPAAPDDLPEAGRELFDRLAADLDAAGLITAVDGPLLALAVRAYLHAGEASDVLLSEGPLGTGSMGQPVAHPASQVFVAQSRAYLEAGRALGLSLAARARITVPSTGEATDDGNPFSGASTTG